MSLTKRPTITEKRIAASRANGKRSRGRFTAEVRECIRAAHRRHGFYGEAETAMRALGEDPADFQELMEGLWETYDPTNAAQEGLVIRLARATWLTNRADRMQEGYAVRQAAAVDVGRQDRLHVQMMRLKMTAERLRRLVQSVARDHYVTPTDDLEKIKNLVEEGVLKDMGEIILGLFYQLQAPGTGEDGVGPEEKSRRALKKIKEIFGLSSDIAPGAKAAPDFSQPQEGCPAQGTNEADLDLDGRYRNITAGEWEARERPRQLLENILTRQAEICEAQRQAILKESLAGPSPYERAAEIAPTHPNALLMRRFQDSHLREVRRVTNLLLRVKRYERQGKALRND